MEDEMVFDYLLGEWKLKDTKTIEKTVEIRGGGGTASNGATAIVQADAPTGSQGQLWLDTDDNTLYVFVNGSWVAISGGGAVVDGVLLNESGDYFITEDDNYLATE
jgi:hypothetical protein